MKFQNNNLNVISKHVDMNRGQRVFMQLVLIETAKNIIIIFKHVILPWMLSNDRFRQEDQINAMPSQPSKNSRLSINE